MTSSPNYKNKKTPVLSRLSLGIRTRLTIERVGGGVGVRPPPSLSLSSLPSLSSSLLPSSSLRPPPSSSSPPPLPPLGILGVVASFAERKETPMRQRRCRERGGQTTTSVMAGGEGMEKIKTTTLPHSRRMKTKTTTRRRKRTTPRGGYDMTGDLGGNARLPPLPRNRDNNDENDG